VLARQAGYRFLGSLKGLQIRALNAIGGGMIFLQDDSSKQNFLVDTGVVVSVLSRHSSSPPSGPSLSGADRQNIPCWGSIRRCLSFGLLILLHHLTTRRRLKDHPRLRLSVRSQAVG
jgi:hypothetical protein